MTASAIGFSAWKKWSVDPAENTGRTGAEGQKEQNANSDDAGEKVNAVEFPYKLEEGKISIDSVFQFTGFNPDNENMEGENIAALTVVNQSEQHLTFAQFTVKLADGAELAFEITDLPAGQKAMIFEKENQIYELDDVCREITDTAEFEDASPVMADRLSAEVQETTVTLTNNSEEDLSESASPLPLRDRRRVLWRSDIYVPDRKHSGGTERICRRSGTAIWDRRQLSG